MRKLTWGSLFFAAGITVVLLLKLDIIRPEEWFSDEPSPSPIPSELLQQYRDSQADDTPAFATLTYLDRQTGTTRAGQVISQSGLVANLIQGLNSSIRLPRTIYIQLKPCGVANAFYDPNSSQIIFCDEFLHQFEQAFSSSARDQADFESAVLGSTAFFIFHEIGHALIDQLDLTFLGREEDAADDIATYLLTTSGASAQAFRGAQFFAILSQYQPASDFPYWDEHSLNEQRFYSVSCLLYGYEPGRFAFLVSSHVLPLEAAQGCPARAVQSSQTVAGLLGPHLKTNG